MKCPLVCIIEKLTWKRPGNGDSISRNLLVSIVSDWKSFWESIWNKFLFSHCVHICLLTAINWSWILNSVHHILFQLPSKNILTKFVIKKKMTRFSSTGLVFMSVLLHPMHHLNRFVHEVLYTLKLKVVFIYRILNFSDYLQIKIHRHPKLRMVRFVTPANT